MSTYKAIRGKLVKTVTADPTPATNYEGEMWYNTTIGALKVAGPIASVWSTAANSSLPATGAMVSFGSQTAAVLCGGSVPAPSPVLSNSINAVQEYNEVYDNYKDVHTYLILGNGKITNVIKKNNTQRKKQ